MQWLIFLKSFSFFLFFKFSYFLSSLIVSKAVVSVAAGGLVWFLAAITTGKMNLHNRVYQPRCGCEHRVCRDGN